MLGTRGEEGGVMFRLLVLVAFASYAGPAQGQTSRSVQYKPDWVTDQMAADTLHWAMSNITKGVDERGQWLRPLTEEEAGHPLLEVELVKEIMDVGRASVAGLRCDLDWQERNYRKLMKRERARGDRSTHQLAAIGMIHGYTMGKFPMDVPCPAQERARLEDFYARKWQ
jgi:hypothetical protein